MKLVLTIAFIILVALGSCTRVQPYLSIEVTSEGWVPGSPAKPRLGEESAHGLLVMQRPVSKSYVLDRPDYRMEIRTNPKDRIHAISAEIEISSTEPDRSFMLGIAWQGQCAKFGDLAELGQLGFWGNGEFANRGAVGFSWWPAIWCAETDTKESSEEASTYPLLVSVFDQEGLLEVEAINFEITRNGYWAYSSVP